MVHLKFVIGQCVTLFEAGTPGFGGLNPLFLSQEGYCDGWVSVVDTKHDGYTGVVELPSGYLLDIKGRDVQSTRTP